MNYTYTLKADPVVGAESNQTVCAGAAVSTSFSANTGGGEVFSWTNDNVLIGLPASGVGDLAFNAASNTTGAAIIATISVTATLNGCTSSSPETFTITVDPTPQVVQQADVTGCAGDAQAQITFTSDTDPGTSYAWSVTNFALLGMGSGSGSTDNIPSFTYGANATGADIIGIVTVTSTEAGCVSSVMSYTYTLKADPVVGAESNQTVCAGAAVSTSFSANTGGGEVFSWTNDNVLIGLPASGVGDLAFNAASNTTGAAIIATISVTATLNGCTSSSPETFTITVDPTPQVVQQADVTGCAGDAQAQITFTSDTDPGTSYAWSVTNFALLGMGSGSGVTDNIPSFTYAGNVTGIDIIGIVTVTSDRKSVV